MPGTQLSRRQGWPRGGRNVPRATVTCLTLLLGSPAARAGVSDVAPRRGTTGYVLVAPQGGAVAAGPISPILYLNGCPTGCELQPGNDDARANTSALIGASIHLSPFKHGAAIWDAMVACVRDVYAAYGVQVVTTDPGQVFHHEAIIAGTADEAGFTSGQVLGVAPLAYDCSPQNNVISLSFANAHPADAEHLCWTVAQESAHAFGLDHEFDCRTPMTYLPGCARKFFRDEFLPCGEFEERPCQCSGSVQNAHRKLVATFGTGTTPPPPVIEVYQPSDGATVSDGFAVYAGVTDRRGVKEVELRINGSRYAVVPGKTGTAPYALVAPALADGYLDLELVARNDLGAESAERLTVLKGAPCSSAESCTPGQVCEDGRCRWLATAAPGEACAVEYQCQSQLCLEHAGERRCSQPCLVGVADQCPADLECLAAAGGGAGACWPRSTGCGCRTDGDRAPAPLAPGAIAALWWRLRRRRARKPH